ncbi:MAG TPA: GNAT family N-acetyltransferase [Candidatus Limnocylindrales bacterium]|jgi:mycothiol synthase|nr:GNAT family N-acetyltransferase [Candidatus Limnocylindrales bacterium]
MRAAVTQLRLRRYARPGDVADMVRVVNAAAVADCVEEFWSEESMHSWIDHPTEQFDARRDVVLAELAGRVVGAGGMDWVDTRDGLYREYRFWGAVDPPFRDQGIGSALVAHQERHARELASGQALDREPVLGTFAPVGRPFEVLLRNNRFEVVRWFFDMVRPHLDAVEIAPMPEGLELRPVTPEQHETIWRANREAFRDHWGGADESLEAMRRLLDDPDTDTSLWLIAWDGDEVAGGVWNDIHAAENRELGLARGWLASVFTRRAWRQRGLARALIGRSLELLRSRGMTTAALGVDADNPSGALGLYERAGFEIHERFCAWRRPLREAP